MRGERGIWLQLLGKQRARGLAVNAGCGWLTSGIAITAARAAARWQGARHPSPCCTLRGIMPSLCAEPARSPGKERAPRPPAVYGSRVLTRLLLPGHGQGERPLGSREQRVQERAGELCRGTEEVVYGEVGGSILLLCRNVSKAATEVVWFQGDPHSVPPLFSSIVTFPQDVRFSLVDNSSLHITELRRQDEGNYTCKEVLNKTDHEHRVQLLVANPPRSSLKCWAGTSSSGQMLQLFCSWPGGSPHPTLHWREEGGNLENTSWVISSTSSADTHVETLNSSRLSHRKTFKCVGSHVVKQEEPACTVQIKRPSLESEPLQTCFVGDDVTLTCRVTESTPAARLSWLQGTGRAAVEIQPGGRYLVTQEGNVSRLTIQNCSQDVDDGCYVCKAQNPVGLREIFICLTVKRPVNIVGVVGAVVVLSLLALLVLSGIVLYYHPLLCLRGTAFRNPDSSDILVLVDSEDDDEGNGEEEIPGSSTKHEVMALVNGTSTRPAHLTHLVEGER
ncbi:PREDICTED: V-set and immunoglobulin domain-containing protein 10-like [Tinamus guttatus]|uniref:V-set and immunoglobulin domain-containing protein 10-like n=1 Tax=Tinamus guttatus TaxID=94827 RepID=UPI00052F3ED9|nr:PREDICTED: V-set and immunoglobulin domain-containing protein 10-like [Tinamus guttatus]